MEKETELYLIKRIKELEDFIIKLKTCDKTTLKANAFDELVEKLGLEYQPLNNSVIISKTCNLSLGGIDIYIYNLKEVVKALNGK